MKLKKQLPKELEELFKTVYSKQISEAVSVLNDESKLEPMLYVYPKLPIQTKINLPSVKDNSSENRIPDGSRIEITDPNIDPTLKTSLSYLKTCKYENAAFSYSLSTLIKGRKPGIVTTIIDQDGTTATYHTPYSFKTSLKLGKDFLKKKVKIEKAKLVTPGITGDGKKDFEILYNQQMLAAVSALNEEQRLTPVLTVNNKPLDVKVFPLPPVKEKPIKKNTEKKPRKKSKKDDPDYIAANETENFFEKIPGNTFKRELSKLPSPTFKNAQEYLKNRSFDTAAFSYSSKKLINGSKPGIATVIIDRSRIVAVYHTPYKKKGLFKKSVVTEEPKLVELRAEP